MATHNDRDAATDVSMDGIEESDAPADRLAAATDGLPGGTLPLVGGGLALAAAVRSLAANRPRAIPLGIVGTGLVGYGLSKRRSSGEAGTEDGVPDAEDGTEEKGTSDAASAAANRVDAGRISEMQPDGEIADEPTIGETQATDAGAEFTDDPDDDIDSSRPDLGPDEEDPRRDTGHDEVAVDVSDPAMAEEESEAAGPDPRQAQPTQTEGTEPEESPAADASHMKVDPPDPDEPESDPDEADATDGEEDGDAEDEADAASDDEADEREQ